MKRRISFLLMLCMILSFCAFSAAPAMAEDWKLPEGTPMYRPNCAMETDFGMLIVQDAGFCKKAQSIIQVSTMTRTTNGVSQTTENRHVGYYIAKDGKALFAFTGILLNTSEQALTLEELHPTIQFNDDEPIKMYGYPAVPFGVAEYYTLEPGATVEIVFACTVPNSLYFGSQDILLAFSEGTLGFSREDVGNYISVGFTENDFQDAGDITETDVSDPADAVKKQPHIDEVGVEDASLEFDSAKSMYQVHVKARNLTGYPEILDKLPSWVTVKGQFLDASGDMLPGGNVELKCPPDLAIGQAGWDTGYTKVSKNVVDEAVSIRFSSYEFFYNAIIDGTSRRVEGRFSEPVVINIADLLPERKEAGTPSMSTASSTEYFMLDAFCVDDNARVQESDRLRLVYLFYTFNATDKNLEIDSKYTYLKINGVNEYESEYRFTDSKPLRSYLHTQYIQHVYMGDSVKVLAIFKIPEADLAPGRTVTIRDSQIPGAEQIHFSTDILQHFDSVDAMAEAIDPDGYAEICEMREPADAELTARVDNAILNKKFSCTVSGLTYAMTFRANNVCEVSYGISNGSMSAPSTYSVCKGFIIVEADKNHYVLEVPYYFKDDGSIWLDVDDAYGV